MTITGRRVVLRHRHVLRAVIALATIVAWSLSLGIVTADVPPGTPPGGSPGGSPGGPSGGTPPPPSANVSVFATGLQAPRGLRFGPDGNLYVAEAGTGGTTTTVGQCDQVGAVRPYSGGKTSRISKISATGTRTTVVDGLASTRDQMGDTLGVADVEFVGGPMYALIGGGGCSHGNTDTPNGIIKVNADGTWTRAVAKSDYGK